MVVQMQGQRIEVGETGVLRDMGTQLDGQQATLACKWLDRARQTLMCHFLLASGVVVEAPYRFFKIDE